jgi:hypothetical protein
LGKTENKLQKVGIFLEAEKCPSTHHNYHAFHHNLTIKKPRSANQFPQNPLQKHPSAITKKYCRTNSKRPGSLPASWLKKSD